MFRFLLAFLPVVLSQDAAGPIVSTASGPVQGVLRGSAVTWWGIPFAEPPVGDLRFRSPQPLKRTWTTPFQASKIPALCPQFIVKELVLLGHEDCLYLNVHSPRNPRTKGPLAVMVWFYGGGFTLGDGYEFGLYDGQHLAERHDLMVVTMNYRLGDLGFFALDALKNEDPNGSTGNYGVQDQQLALRWVQQNIAGFGGDPGRVTIFGESAGAFSVMWHLVSPKSKGLFRAAVMESGTTSVNFFFQPYHDATQMYQDISAIAGCPSSPQQLSCLRALPAHKLLNQTLEALRAIANKQDPDKPAYRSPLWPIMPNGPVIDGSEYGLLDVPLRLVQAGRFNEVPLILGANENGGSIFEPMLPMLIPGIIWPASLRPKEVQVAFDYFFASNASAVAKVYTAEEYDSAAWAADSRLSRMVRDMLFLCPARALATSFVQKGLPAFLYVFHFDFGLMDQVSHLGDFHAAELPFVWRNWLEYVKALVPLQSPYDMADIMSCKWASFAYNLDPNGGEDETLWPPNCNEVNKRYSDWPRFDVSQRLFYSLKAKPEVHAILADNIFPDDLFPRDPKCDLWDKLSAYLPWQGPKAASKNVFV